MMWVDVQKLHRLRAGARKGGDPPCLQAPSISSLGGLGNAPNSITLYEKSHEIGDKYYYGRTAAVGQNGRKIRTIMWVPSGCRHLEALWLEGG